MNSNVLKELDNRNELSETQKSQLAGLIAAEEQQSTKDILSRWERLHSYTLGYPLLSKATVPPIVLFTIKRSARIFGAGPAWLTPEALLSGLTFVSGEYEAVLWLYVLAEEGSKLADKESFVTAAHLNEHFFSKGVPSHEALVAAWEAQPRDELGYQLDDLKFWKDNFSKLIG
jgi:hypothetical protein